MAETSFIIENGRRLNLKDASARKSIGSCSELETDTKHCLVDAVNELNRKVKDGVGEKGEPGEDGKDGVSCTHSWNGTVLTVTSASGTSSADLKGDSGKDGYTPVKGVDYFDGAPGADGKDGQDGYTPVKGVDYFDGQDGQPGKDGANGVSCIHSWNGTTLTVTSASGTSSANLKGDKGDKGDPGEGSGDMLSSVYDPKGKAQDVFTYVDNKIAAIPAPDVSAQISAHNSDTSAHNDIRTAVSNAASAAASAQTAANNAASAAATAQSTANGKANASHTHGAGDITSGTLAVARGGTGVTSNPSMLTNLESTTAASVFAASPRPGVTGTLPVKNGGTGKTSWTANRLVYPSASTTMNQLAFPSTAGSFLRQGTSGAPYWTKPADVLSAIGAAASSHKHAAGDITSGTLSVDRGGTGVTSLSALATALGVTSGGLKIESGTYKGANSSKKTITFSGTPQIVLIMADSGTKGINPYANGGWEYTSGIFVSRGQTSVYTNGQAISVSFGTNSVSLDSGNYTLYAMNSSGTFAYLAICT